MVAITASPGFRFKLIRKAASWMRALKALRFFVKFGFPKIERIVIVLESDTQGWRYDEETLASLRIC